jgi:hypothetical protein
MSEAGAFIREEKKIAEALQMAYLQLDRLRRQGLGGLSPRDCTESLRNASLCLAHTLYLEAALKQTAETGSRGGSLVLCADGQPISEKLAAKWKVMPENKTFREKMICCSLKNNKVEFSTQPCRPIPETDGWFETVWHDCRNGKIYNEE